MRDQDSAPYVPRLARRLLRGVEVVQHARWTLDACVMLVDVSGFTAIAERLSTRDPSKGAERLQEALNRCFGPLNALVDAAGGEVLAYPGDAALALWTAEDTGDPSGVGALQRAVTCSAQVQQAVQGLADVDGVQLRVRAAIASGPVTATVVGGADGAWEFVVTGEAVQQLRDTLAVAQAGEVVLSPAAADRAGPTLTGAMRNACLVLQGAVASTTEPSITPSLPPLDATARAFVPRTVQLRIDAGQAAWLAEFRTMTVMFLNLGMPGPEPEALHHVVHAIQESVGRFGGSVNQVVADDKGTTIVVGFGSALRVHEDDPVRAIRTALEVRERLRKSGTGVGIGVATGRVFTGTRGGASRLEFALIGETVILAARLSGRGDDTLCDEATQTASAVAIEFDTAGEVVPKGKSIPIPVFRPRAVKTRRSGLAAPDGGPAAAPPALIGRTRERAVLDRRLDTLAQGGRGGAVFIEGEAGLGKSTLVRHVTGLAATRDISVLAGAADSIERNTPYLAWRPIVVQMLGPEAAQSSGALRQRLAAMVGAGQLGLTPLLNPMLPLGLPEDAATLALNAEVRARLVRELIVAAVQHTAATQAQMLLLEDVHWLDSASWELAEAVVRSEPRVLMVMTMRPVDERSPEHERLLDRRDTERVVLEPLDRADIRTVICRRLAVNRISDELATVIGGRAEGQPLFAEELALALRDGGFLDIEDGSGRIRGSIDRLAAFPFPQTVSGVVASRIDRLTPEQQLTLKAAAVLGRQFDLTGLAAVHPLSAPPAQIEEELAQISRSGLLHGAEGGDGTRLFSHAVVQDVAYQLLPYTQRRALHQRAAVWLERTAADLDAGSPLLAHHWESAEVVPKAMEYLERAGTKALHRDGANREAAEFFRRLIGLAEQVEGESDTAVTVRRAGRLRSRHVRLAQWEHKLTQALFRQGLHKAMLPHLMRCLELLGQKLPSSASAMDVRFFWGLLPRLIRSPRQPSRRPYADDLRAALVSIVQTYETLGISSYYTGNVVQGRLALLRSVQWAERAGLTAELSRAYSTFAIVPAVFHRSRIARQYMAIARGAADALQDAHAQFVALGRGQLPHFIVGEWDVAIPALEQAVVLGATVGDPHGHQIHMYQLALVRLNRGDTERALDDFRRLLHDARESRTAVNQLWALAGLSETTFRLGRLEEAIAYAAETVSLAASVETTDQNGRFQAYGVLARSWLRQEGIERARPFLEAAMAAGRAGGRSSYAPQMGFLGVTDVLLAIRQRGGADSQQADAALKDWLSIMRVEGFFKPIVKPWHLIVRARWHRLRGRHRRAVSDLRQAISLSERLHLPYEAAVARTDLGQALPVGDPERDRHLQEARQAFERIGARGEPMYTSEHISM